MWKSVKRKMNWFKTEFEMTIDESQWETNWRKQWFVFWIGCQCQDTSSAAGSWPYQHKAETPCCLFSPPKKPVLQQHIACQRQRVKKQHKPRRTKKQCNIRTEKQPLSGVSASSTTGCVTFDLALVQMSVSSTSILSWKKKIFLTIN